MTPVLNWKELAAWVSDARSSVEGLFLERIVVPERPKFPGGYLKAEWALRLTGRRSEGVFLFSVRPRHPYVAFIPGKKGPKAAPGGTRSPFDLALSKQLKGAKLEKLMALERERIVILWFNAEGDRLGLVLCLIPATPEAFLVRDENGALLILARSRTIRDEAKAAKFFEPPSGAKPPAEPEVRTAVLADFTAVIEHELEVEAFEARVLVASRALRELLKQTKDRLRQSETGLREANAEPDWQRYGDLLKSALHLATPIESGARVIEDFETGDKISVPCDPQLSPSEQLKKFYAHARRKQRRLEESALRIETLREGQRRWENGLESPPKYPDWAALERLERIALPGTMPQRKSAKESSEGGKKGAWLGRTYLSKDGWPIMVGRSKDENLELTFKHARGNDLWFHVRGRPGAHVVVPMPSGKSIPLETLIDAATLALYYSGGENWGKTEVDYTFKKHVKRIKDSSEASYTGNKTLIIEVDAKRVARVVTTQT